jgi:Divergent InlB B-repeat domain
MCSASFLEGTTVQLEAVGSGKYEFFEWSGSCVGKDPACKFSVTRNVEVQAKFQVPASPPAPPPIPKRFTVSVVTNGSGSVSSLPAGISCGTISLACIASFREGTTVQLEATSRGQSEFVEWAGSCVGKDPRMCIFSVTQNVSVQAKFQVSQTVVVDPPVNPPVTPTPTPPTITAPDFMKLIRRYDQLLIRALGLNNPTGLEEVLNVNGDEYTRVTELISREAGKGCYLNIRPLNVPQLGASSVTGRSARLTVNRRWNATEICANSINNLGDDQYPYFSLTTELVFDGTNWRISRTRANPLRQKRPFFR